ncbi:hypothetical protein CDAR_100641 [Caerostris darwini]|uniref:Uncharacterized protein n=1 Tax=Caerostris darwini TaxID=1538125 RepID=A0AAV4MF57_9ARAC|nr:hypothetical protein CDAR_100641 [Caerostris darwini]
MDMVTTKILNQISPSWCIQHKLIATKKFGNNCSAVACRAEENIDKLHISSNPITKYETFCYSHYKVGMITIYNSEITAPHSSVVLKKTWIRFIFQTIRLPNTSLAVKVITEWTKLSLSCTLFKMLYREPFVISRIPPDNADRDLPRNGHH